MPDKLIQKHLLHGTQTFEIRDDFIRVNINSLLRGNKELDVELAMLNPDPVIDGSMLHFHSRVKCGPLLSLYLNKPNQKDFNAFVDSIKSKARKEYEAFAGLSTPRV